MHFHQLTTRDAYASCHFFGNNFLLPFVCFSHEFFGTDDDGYIRLAEKDNSLCLPFSTHITTFMRKPSKLFFVPICFLFFRCKRLLFI